MATQKALWLPHVGAEFMLSENMIHRPSPGEVLVKLEASALNPIDWKVKREGFFMVEGYPVILGVGGSGVVTHAGRDVTNLVPGDRVTFSTDFGIRNGTFQMYCPVVADLATKIPDNVSFDEAASVVVGLSPFAVATYTQEPYGIALTPPVEPEGLGKYTHQPIVIMGGACSLGQYAIQLAKLSGFDPIITTASMRNEDLLRSLGATHVLDRELPGDTFTAHVKTLTRAPIPYIFDAVSHPETQQTSYDLLAPGGTLAIVSTRVIQEDASSGKKIFFVLGSFHLPENRVLGIKFAAALTTWLQEGAIKPNAVQVLPGGLNGVEEGLRMLESGGVSAKKLVVRPPETRLT